MARILQAVGEVIAERGTNRIGINAVAEKAGVNKVLIYRYFGGWEGLMQRFLQEGSILAKYNNQFLESAVVSEGASGHQNRVNYLIGLLRELRARTSAQEMLKWEMSNPGLCVSQKLATTRNESYQKVIEKFFADENEDLTAVSAVLISGITMLLLMAPSQSQFMNVDLKSEEGWQRIEQAIQQVYKALE
ncbi:TetR/AcrR family transcriptional regulator [Larkinella ripae]